MSLADELLADFESDEFDGDDAEDPVDDKHNVKAHAENGVETGLNWDDMDGEGGFEAFGDMLEEGGNVKGEGGVVLGLDSPRKVARLLDSTKFKDIMREVREFMLKERGAVVGSVEMDPEYQLIVKANKMTVDIDGDIQVLHKYVRDIYSKRFPELEQLVHQPMEYMRTVQMIGNDLDIAKKDLASILPGPSVMIVTVSAANR
ncbi:hypothetical protein SARC_07666 [Sphaeroforma arctica JP610]|uniref:NOSIC domain-containing protein n=1 Tax=Sphaeroforma arctica JP610 TaxID=667725 RepID=A0A0L0FT29_9EUKA|nr:hypothetical protein SARC_07666 [Sphaeroforma arctica JP610]KNC79950.1 hypothetical protein SARC_07666 [Sphaeroforma arctica JP610]|eukprot:XP_014153852.1 hypothetical protein SARC_07666 [Sphaeroforma arctica JP610]